MTQPRPPMPPGFAEAIAARFGADAITSESARRPYGQSEAHFAEALPDIVVIARSTQDVVDCVNLCVAHAVPITAYGAGTSIEGNALPIHGGLSIDLSAMNRIVAVNPEDFDCTVEAGVRREELNHYLRDMGLFFPIDPGANATIGGMASTRASGTNAVRYGTMRDAVVSLKVVTPDGRVIRTARRARKSSAGYDLTRLFVGAEGTLGIITEVTLRLHPLPDVIAAAVCGFASLKGAVDTVVEAVQCGVPLARVELLDDRQIAAVNTRSALGLDERNTLFFEFHGSATGVAEQVEMVARIAEANGGGAFDFADRPEERTRLWRARHEAYYAAVNMRPGAVGWTTDVCVPISRLVECIVATRADLDDCPVPATILGHVGDGNFHVIFSLDPASSEEAAAVKAVNARLIERALAMDGTCTGEHGIGLGKIEWLEVELGDAVDLMRSIKRAIDPATIFNPGKVFR